MLKFMGSNSLTLFYCNFFINVFIIYSIYVFILYYKSISEKNIIFELSQTC